MVDSSYFPLVMIADPDNDFRTRIEGGLAELGVETSRVSTMDEIIEIAQKENRPVVVFLHESFSGFHAVLEAVANDNKLSQQMMIYIMAKNPSYALVDTCMGRDAFVLYKGQIKDALWLLPYIKKGHRDLLFRASNSVLEDRLTGLDTFLVFEKEVKKKLSAFNTRGYPTAFSLLLVDVDGMKHFNDTYGYPTTDLVLKIVAMDLKGHIRQIDEICRFHEAGDEILIWLEGIGEADAFTKAEELREKIASIRIHDRVPRIGVHEKVSISVGVVEAVKGAETLEAMIERAHPQLVQEKNKKKNKAA